MDTKSRVMIVEDESIVAMDIEGRLKHLGYDVVRRAISGEEAVQQSTLLRPDVILMDIQLQGQMDGIEAAQKIRSTYDIPIIYLSAYSDPETIRRAKLTTPAGYLVKPFEERELHTTIETALYKSDMERKLRNQSQQLASVVNTIPMGIMMVDGEGCITLSNSIADEYIVLLGTFSEDYLDKLGDYSLKTLFATPGIWHEIIIEQPQKRIFNLSVHDAIQSKESKDTRWLIVINDVTEHYQLLQRSYEQSNLAAVGQLAAGIAHDFNNILSILVLSHEMILLKDTHLETYSRELLNNNLTQIKRGSKLVAQMLDFSRRSPMEMQPLDLCDFCTEVLKILRSMLPENIRMNWVSGDETHWIKADTTRMHQVLLNLAINAKDAMVDGGTIGLEVESVMFSEQQAQQKNIPAGQWIKLSFSDTGCGIPESKLSHIFEPFFTTKEQGKGTGLGLAQVYGIVHQHGGFIEVDSTEGEGTRFDLYFQAVNEDGELMPLPDNDELEVSSGQQKTVLLVEDEFMLRENLTLVLGALNYQVLTAKNGLEALEVFAEKQSVISLILTDVMMPKMGGLELCSQLRSQSVDIPILVMSGYSSDLSAEKLAELRVNAFLQKPISVQTISETLDEVLKGSSDES